MLCFFCVQSLATTRNTLVFGCVDVTVSFRRDSWHVGQSVTRCEFIPDSDLTCISAPAHRHATDAAVNTALFCLISTCFPVQSYFCPHFKHIAKPAPSCRFGRIFPPDLSDCICCQIEIGVRRSLAKYCPPRLPISHVKGTFACERLCIFV